MKESERNISECILAFKKSRDMIKRRKMNKNERTHRGNSKKKPKRKRLKRKGFIQFLSRKYNTVNKAENLVIFKKFL